jgi:hypothetical protein
LKSRFVGKGFQQKYSLNYIDTFASVIKQLAWRLIFALAIINGWLIYKIDMISAFTQGNIDYFIYMSQPEGYIDSRYPDHVLRLNKALYGLKQSARIWYDTLKEVLLNKLDFKSLLAEGSIFINQSTGIILCVYVDDIAVIGPNQQTIKSFISNIKRYFNIKKLGLIKNYLGVDIDYRPQDGYLKLYQAKYINKILAKYGFKDLNPAKTLMDSKAKLEPNKGRAKASETHYFQMFIGSLLFLALACRPDITFAVIKLARFASNPSQDHVQAIKRVFRYLKGTVTLGIIYSSAYNSLYLQGYCDADYAGDLATAKSTTGYLFVLAGGPIMWKSKLQSIVAQSSTESEYIAINTAAKELEFIRNILWELKVNIKTQERFPLYTDNNGALLLASNPVFHERTKHILVRFHYIRELINKGLLDLIHMPSKDQKADGLTKPLDTSLFLSFVKHLGLN